VNSKIMALFFFIGSMVLFLIVLTMFSLVNWQNILNKLIDFINALKTYIII